MKMSYLWSMKASLKPAIRKVLCVLNWALIQKGYQSHNDAIFIQSRRLKTQLFFVLLENVLTSSIALILQKARKKNDWLEVLIDTCLRNKTKDIAGLYNWNVKSLGNIWPLPKCSVNND